MDASLKNLDWEKAGGGTFVKLGEGEGRQRHYAGVLTGIREDKTYGGIILDFSGKGGAAVSIKANAQLERNLGVDDIGKLCDITYEGTAKTKNGFTAKQFTVLKLAPEKCPDDLKAQYPAIGQSPDPAPLTDTPPALASDAGDDDLPF